MKRLYVVRFTLNEPEDILDTPDIPVVQDVSSKGSVIIQKAVVVTHDGGPNVRALLDRHFTELKGVISHHYVQTKDIHKFIDLTDEQAIDLGAEPAEAPTLPRHVVVENHIDNIKIAVKIEGRQVTCVDPKNPYDTCKYDRQQLEFGAVAHLYFYSMEQNLDMFDDSEEPAAFLGGKDISIYKMGGIIPELITCLDNVDYEDSSEQAVREFLGHHLPNSNKDNTYVYEL